MKGINLSDDKITMCKQNELDKRCGLCSSNKNLLITDCQRYICRSCFENSEYTHLNNNFNDLCPIDSSIDIH